MREIGKGIFMQQLQTRSKDVTATQPQNLVEFDLFDLLGQSRRRKGWNPPKQKSKPKTPAQQRRSERKADPDGWFDL